ncbi:alpha-ketoglutarate-dependent dioxygenase AlkB family protein [Muriicola sp.]|uniref:alpha-ketoglutarate-dependent dioxygenase AlkB family protein n=1 Tax=Muriicola sp. TaxID=2020856 RepID=UPI003C73DB8E
MTRNVNQIDLPQSDISFYPGFLRSEDATALMDILKRTIAWQQDHIMVFGKTYPQPRLTALYGNNQKSYSYSNITMYPHPFTKELEEVKSRIETLIPPTVFSSCLLNLYRDGKDSNGWHADDEDSLGKDPVIASVSLGEERYFHFKNKQDSSLKYKMLLNHGSLLIMKGSTQHHWLHQIPKTSRKIGERINLTFRVIK